LRLTLIANYQRFPIHDGRLLELEELKHCRNKIGKFAVAN